MRLTLITLLLSFTIISCNKAEPVLPGDLGRINDSVMGPCKPYNLTEPHTCIFFADEFNNRIRVYDATDRQFVLAPSAYYPLSLSDGSSPSALAMAPAHPYLFSLDSANARISVFRTVNEQGGTVPFGQKLTQLALTDGTEFGATSIVAIAHPDLPNLLLLVVSVRSPSNQPQDHNRLVYFLFDTTTASQLAGSTSYDLPLPAAPNNLAISALDNNNTLIAVSQDSHDISLITARDLLLRDPSRIQHLPANGPTGMLNIANVNDGTSTALHVFAIRKNMTSIAYELVDAPIASATPAPNGVFAGKLVSVDGLPMALFAPGITTDSCCLNSVSQWIVVVTEKGVLQYISLPNFDKVPLKNAGSTNLVLGRNLNVNAVHPITMVGGAIISPDPATQRAITGNQPRQWWGNQIFIGFDAGTVGSFKYGQIEVQNLETVYQN